VLAALADGEEQSVGYGASIRPRATALVRASFETRLSMDPNQEGPGTMALDFAPDTAIVAVADHASCELGGETVVLDLHTGVYYGLDVVGGRVWRLLEAPRSLSELRDLIVDEFDVAAGRCETDLAAFVASLNAHGLLRSCDAVNR
jgi:coenzyme PQQ synthesis protein D (PqqD)